MKNITCIRSPHFTIELPKRSKFKLDQRVRLRKLTDLMPEAQPAAHRRYGAGKVGVVIGMNYKKGNYMRCYPYYVQFDDGYVFPIKPCYLTEENTGKAKAKQAKTEKRWKLRNIIEDMVREVLKDHGGYVAVEDHRKIDRAIKNVRKLYE
jgi:hypothetical protein